MVAVGVFDGWVVVGCPAIDGIVDGIVDGSASTEATTALIVTCAPCAMVPFASIKVTSYGAATLVVMCCETRWPSWSHSL